MNNILSALKGIIFLVTCFGLAGCILTPDLPPPGPKEEQKNTAHVLIINIDKAFMMRESIYAEIYRIGARANDPETAVEQSIAYRAYDIQAIEFSYAPIIENWRYFSTERSVFYYDRGDYYQARICCFTNFDSLAYNYGKGIEREKTEKEINIKKILLANQTWQTNRLSSEIRDIELSFRADKITVDFKYYLSVEGDSVQNKVNLYSQPLND